MKRRAFLQRVPAVVAGSALFGFSGRVQTAANASVAPHTSGMNVLCIAIDGLRADSLTAEGPCPVETPHLDAFAAGALRFNRCYCQIPQRDLSRLSALTGRRPEEATGQVRPEAGQSLPEFLGGYGFDSDVTAEPPLDFEMPAEQPGQFFRWVDLALGDALTRAMVDAYHEAVASVDRRVGVLLDALERAGLNDRTLVLVFGTHGVQLGEHDSWSEPCLCEPSTRVPLLVRVPGQTARPMVCDEIVELVDLFPTLCELLLIPAPGDLEGTSLVPLLADPRCPWKLAAFTTCAVDGVVGHSVRTKRWRYTDWKSNQPSLRRFEMYDLDRDPAEQTDLARNAAYRNPRTILANLLQRGWYVAQESCPRGRPTAAAPARQAQHILW